MIRTVVRAVATVGGLAMPRSRTLARIFGSLERRLQPSPTDETDWSNGLGETVVVEDLRTDGGREPVDRTRAWEEAPGPSEDVDELYGRDRRGRNTVVLRRRGEPSQCIRALERDVVDLHDSGNIDARLRRLRGGRR